MNRLTIQILIAVVLITFVLITLALQSICTPDKNPVSATVSSYVEKTFTEPTPQRVDPLSYDGVKNMIVRWASQYCKR